MGGRGRCSRKQYRKLQTLKEVVIQFSEAVSVLIVGLKMLRSCNVLIVPLKAVKLRARVCYKESKLFIELVSVAVT